MEQIIHYFQNIPSSHRSLILVGGLTFFFLIENIIPLFKFKVAKTNHTLLNIFFTLTTVIVNFLFAFLILKLSDYLISQKFGIMNWVEMPLWVSIVIGLLIFDLVGAWLAHFVQHKVKWMWRFHLIHHTDAMVDTTTANRHHPGESVIRVLFTIAGVVILGAPLWLLMMYQSMSVVLSQFNHANIRLPKKLDDIISWIIVSPDMHKIHHHFKLPQTDSNYGNIFAIWDRLFGTFIYVKDITTLTYGLDTYAEKKEHSNLSKLLAHPFQAYRHPDKFGKDSVEL